MSTDTDPREHLFDLIRDFDDAMLVTCTAYGHLRARPMALAKPVDADGHLYFATAVDSPKVQELEHDARVAVVLQGKARFVSVSGHARVVNDRALIERLWSEAWKVWFPAGKDDPRLCLLAVEPEEAEYWDQAGARGLRYLFRAARAYVTHETPQSDTEQNAKVRLT